MERIRHIPSVTQAQSSNPQSMTFCAFNRKGWAFQKETLGCVVGLESRGPLNYQALARWLLLNGLDEGPCFRALAWETEAQGVVAYFFLPQSWKTKTCSVALTQHIAWLEFMEVQIAPSPQPQRSPRPAAPQWLCSTLA